MRMSRVGFGRDEIGQWTVIARVTELLRRNFVELTVHRLLLDASFCLELNESE